MFKISFIITGLSTGGAEMMLFKLLSAINRKAFAPQVISLLDKGPMYDQFNEIDVPVETIGMSRGAPDPRGIFRLSRLLRRNPPHLVQTWMYHADLLGGLAAKLAGDMPIIWNIRHSNLDPQIDKRSTILSAKACAVLSRFIPEKIICCANASKNIHATMGYDHSKLLVIPNGFELNSFKPDPRARHDVRDELGLSESTKLIGLVSRFHPQKDHKTFIQAAARLKRTQPGVHFVLCGDGTARANQVLSKWVTESGHEDSFHLLGHREDMSRITAAFDIATSSSSSGEAFSNTIGEAMSCAVPCVVTDVGDSAYIIGDTGKVVPPSDPAALSDAWRTLLALGDDGRSRLGQAARKRVSDCFSLGVVVKAYEDLYSSLLIRTLPSVGKAS